MRAVVLLSGGLDSTVTLAYAIKEGYEVIPLSFNYGQKHSKELRAAKKVVDFYGLEKHVIMEMSLRDFRSALTDPNIPVPERESEKIGYDIPDTYVPARNIIFLSIGAGLCESVDAERLFIGANSLDYSGYPDCRPEFFLAFEGMLEVGTKAGVEGHAVQIEHPILRATKSEIVKLGKKLEAPLDLTWSCYKGGEKACGKCDSCLLRLKGFKEAGFEDEIEYEE